MICPEELATLITATAIGIAQGKSIDELNILACFFVQLSDTLNTIAVQRSILEECCSNQKEDNSDNSPKSSETFVIQ